MAAPTIASHASTGIPMVLLDAHAQPDPLSPTLKCRSSSGELHVELRVYDRNGGALALVASVTDAAGATWDLDTSDDADLVSLRRHGLDVRIVHDYAVRVGPAGGAQNALQFELVVDGNTYVRRTVGNNVAMPPALDYDWWVAPSDSVRYRSVLSLFEIAGDRAPAAPLVSVPFASVHLRDSVLGRHLGVQAAGALHWERAATPADRYSTRGYARTVPLDSGSAERVLWQDAPAMSAAVSNCTNGNEAGGWVACVTVAVPLDTPESSVALSLGSDTPYATAHEALLLRVTYTTQGELLGLEATARDTDGTAHTLETAVRRGAGGLDPRYEQRICHVRVQNDDLSQVHELRINGTLVAAETLAPQAARGRCFRGSAALEFEEPESYLAASEVTTYATSAWADTQEDGAGGAWPAALRIPLVDAVPALALANLGTTNATAGPTTVFEPSALYLDQYEAIERDLVLVKTLGPCLRTVLPSSAPSNYPAPGMGIVNAEFSVDALAYPDFLHCDTGTASATQGAIEAEFRVYYDSGAAGANVQPFVRLVDSSATATIEVGLSATPGTNAAIITCTVSHLNGGGTFGGFSTLGASLGTSAIDVRRWNRVSCGFENAGGAPSDASPTLTIRVNGVVVAQNTVADTGGHGRVACLGDGVRGVSVLNLVGAFPNTGDALAAVRNVRFYGNSTMQTTREMPLDASFALADGTEPTGVSYLGNGRATLEFETYDSSGAAGPPLALAWPEAAAATGYAQREPDLDVALVQRNNHADAGGAYSDGTSSWFASDLVPFAAQLEGRAQEAAMEIDLVRLSTNADAVAVLDFYYDVFGVTRHAFSVECRAAPGTAQSTTTVTVRARDDTTQVHTHTTTSVAAVGVARTFSFRYSGGAQSLFPGVAGSETPATWTRDLATLFTNAPTAYSLRVSGGATASVTALRFWRDAAKASPRLNVDFTAGTVNTGEFAAIAGQISPSAVKWDINELPRGGMALLDRRNAYPVGLLSAGLEHNGAAGAEIRLGNHTLGACRTTYLHAAGVQRAHHGVDGGTVAFRVSHGGGGGAGGAVWVYVRNAQQQGADPTFAVGATVVDATTLQLDLVWRRADGSAPPEAAVSHTVAGLDLSALVQLQFKFALGHTTPTATDSRVLKTLHVAMHAGDAPVHRVSTVVNVDAETALAGPPSHSDYDQVAPLLCPVGDVAVRFVSAGSGLVVADVRAAHTWAPGGADSWVFAFPLDRHLRAHPRSAVIEAHDDATLFPSESAFEFAGPLSCPVLDEPIVEIPLPAPPAPDQAAVPAQGAVPALPPPLVPGDRRFYVQSLPDFGVLFNTLDGTTPTTALPLVLPTLTTTATVLLRIVDPEDVGDKNAVFRYSATDDGLGIASLNSAFICVDIDDTAEETLPIVASSPKTSPLSSLDSLVHGSGDDAGAYTDSDPQDTGFAFSLWVRLAGSLHTADTSPRYILGSGTATDPHNAYLAYRYWPQAASGHTHQLVMRYANNAACMHPVAEFSLGAGLADGAWHLVRVATYLGVEATGRRDWLTHTMIDGVRFRGFDAGKMGAPLPDGCAGLPAFSGNVHQYLALNQQFGGTLSNEAFALDDVAVLRLDSFESLQSVVNQAPLEWWAAHPLLVRYVRFAVGPDSSTAVRDTVSGNNLAAGPFTFADPVTGYAPLVVAGPAFGGAFVGSSGTFNATVVANNAAPEPLRVRILSLPAVGALADGATGAPLGVSSLTTDLRIRYDAPLVGGQPFYVTFTYELVTATTLVASVNTETATVNVQTEYSPEYAGIRSDYALVETGDGTTGTFAPVAAFTQEGGVVMSLWLTQNTTAGHAPYEHQRVHGSDGCMLRMLDSTTSRELALCYRNTTAADPEARVLELRSWTVGVLTSRAAILDLAAVIQFPSVWQYMAVRVTPAAPAGAVFSVRVNSELVANGTLDAGFQVPALSYDEFRVGGADNTVYCLEGVAVLAPATLEDARRCVDYTHTNPLATGHNPLTRWNEDPLTGAFAAAYYLFGEPPAPAVPPVPDLSGNGRPLIDVVPAEIKDSAQSLTEIVPVDQNLQVFEEALTPILLDFIKAGSRVGIFPVIASLPANGVLYQSPDGLTQGAAITGPVNVLTDAPLPSLLVFYQGALDFNGIDSFSFALNYNVTGVTTAAIGNVSLTVDSVNDAFALNAPAVVAVHENEDFAPAVVRNIVPTAIVDVDVAVGPFTTYEVVNATVRCVRTPACPAGTVNTTVCAAFAPTCKYQATGPTSGLCVHQCDALPAVVTATVLPGAQDIEVAAVANRNNRIGGAFPTLLFPVFIDYAVRSPYDNQTEFGSFAVEVTAVNDPFTLSPLTIEPVVQSDAAGINVVVLGLATSPVNDPDLDNEGDTHFIDGSTAPYPITLLTDTPSIIFGPSLGEAAPNIFGDTDRFFYVPGDLDGRVQVAYSVADNGGHSAVGYANITVEASNAPITFVEELTHVLLEDAATAEYRAFGNVDDADGNVQVHQVVEASFPAVCSNTGGDLTGAVVLLANATAGGANSTVQFTPDAHTAGTCTVSFVITDTAPVLPTFFNVTLYFEATAVPDDFVLEAPPGPFTLVEDSGVNADVPWRDGCGTYLAGSSCIDDPDIATGQTATHTVTVGQFRVEPAYMGTASIVGASNLRFTPAAHATGVATLRYNVTDAGGFVHEQSVGITVTNVPDAPNPPVLPQQVRSEGAYTDVRVTAFNLTNTVDYDYPPLGPGDTLTLTIDGVATTVGNCAGVAIPAGIAGNEILFVPTSNTLTGICTISYTVTDSFALSASRTLRVLVTDTNDPWFLPSRTIFLTGLFLEYTVIDLFTSIVDPDLPSDSHSIVSLDAFHTEGAPGTPCPGVNATLLGGTTLQFLENQPSPGVPGAGSVCNATLTLTDSGVPPYVAQYQLRVVLAPSVQTPVIDTLSFPAVANTTLEDLEALVNPFALGIITDPNPGGVLTLTIVTTQTLAGSVSALVAEVLGDGVTIRVVPVPFTNGVLRVTFRVTTSGPAPALPPDFADHYLDLVFTGTQNDFTLVPPGRQTLELDDATIATDVISGGRFNDPDFIFGNYPVGETYNVTVVAVALVSGSLTGGATVNDRNIVFTRSSGPEDEGVVRITYSVQDGGMHVHNASFEIEALFRDPSLDLDASSEISIIGIAIGSAVGGLCCIGLLVLIVILVRRRSGGSLRVRARVGAPAYAPVATSAPPAHVDPYAANPALPLPPTRAAYDFDIKTD